MSGDRQPGRVGSGRTLRLFFALSPPDRLRQAIAVATSLPVRQSGGRPAPVENLHVTLAFLGSVSAGRLSQVMAVAEGVHGHAFTLQLDRLNLWRKEGVLLLDADTPPPALLQLATTLQQALRRADFILEERPFRMHLTLARDVGRRRQPDPALRLPLSLETPLVWPVTDFVLMSSRPGPGGSRYEAQGRWPLD